MVVGFVGEEEIKLDLVIVDGIGGYELIEILPLVHDGLISENIRPNRFVKKCFKCLHELFLVASLIHSQ